MSEIDRRDALRLLAAVPVAGALQGGDAARRHLPLHPSPTTAMSEGAAEARLGDASHTPTFFTAREWETLRVLVDDIIPRDERSGSATDAGVPEYIDAALAGPMPAEARIAVRGGLAWLDAECRRRFDRPFARCSDAERHQLLDDIAWPASARAEMSHGVAFFTRVRDLTAAGFFSSRMGVGDLGYMGNVLVAEWMGCPDAALRKLGVD